MCHFGFTKPLQTALASLTARNPKPHPDTCAYGGRQLNRSSCGRQLPPNNEETRAALHTAKYLEHHCVSCQPMASIPNEIDQMIDSDLDSYINLLNEIGSEITYGSKMKVASTRPLAIAGGTGAAIGLGTVTVSQVLLIIKLPGMTLHSLCCPNGLDIPIPGHDVHIPGHVDVPKKIDCCHHDLTPPKDIHDKVDAAIPDAAVPFIGEYVIPKCGAVEICWGGAATSGLVLADRIGFKGLSEEVDKGTPVVTTTGEKFKFLSYEKKNAERIKAFLFIYGIKRHCEIKGEYSIAKNLTEKIKSLVPLDDLTEDEKACTKIIEEFTTSNLTWVEFSDAKFEKSFNDKYPDSEFLPTHHWCCSDEGKEVLKSDSVGLELNEVIPGERCDEVKFAPFDDLQ